MLKILTDITLTEQEKKDILIAGAAARIILLRMSGMHSCLSYETPVPDLMRAYMYAYGYSNPSQAYALLTELGYGNDPCRNCSGTAL